LTDRQDKPSGTVRIAATDYTIETLLWPKLSPILASYPDIRVEFHMDYGYTDLATSQCDAGVRYGEQVNDGMIAVRIGPDERMACVASPLYIAKYGTPQTPQDLSDHQCINLRLSTHGALYAWEFEAPDGHEIRVKTNGQTCFNTAMAARLAARDGYGFLFVPERMVAKDIANGTLVMCLETYLPYFTGQHFYYPSRRRPSSAFQVVLDALRESS
jgi:DNA-binding transcriptional LysR family regulator